VDAPKAGDTEDGQTSGEEKRREKKTSYASG